MGLSAVFIICLTETASAANESGVFLAESQMRFLDGLTRAVIDASRVAPGGKLGAIGPNETGGTLIRPGGRDCYPAFWIRDYAMALDSGHVTLDEQRHMLLLTASRQQDALWELPSGSVVPANSIPDHITFQGKPIFFPGTLDDYEGQGGPRWGYLPALDDHFYFVHMAAAYIEQGGDPGILDQDVTGTPLFERLERAYAMPPARTGTGLVYAEPEKRGVSFGFVDTVTHTGELLFCSLLKLRAARELASLARLRGDEATANHYQQDMDKLRTAIAGTFQMADGMLKASTGISAQPDVWGTAFAVYIDALPEPALEPACRALAALARDGRTICWRGNIRHVPTSADHSDASAWEQCLARKNTYQNGAYWGTPVGWVCYAVHRVDPETASAIARAYIEELREGDFRKGPESGSPWECMHPDGDHRQNAVYMTSVACPLAAFRKMAAQAP